MYRYTMRGKGLLGLLGIACVWQASGQRIGAVAPPPMPLTVVATSKERVEAESLIQAANGNESKDALRSRIRQSGFVCRERGELMFAFSPMVAASQADYNLQAIVCLLTEPKPLECPHLRTLLEQDINEQIRDTIELDERMNDALRDRPELEGVLKERRTFAPDTTFEKLLAECAPQAQLVAQVWVSMEFDPTRGAPRYELATFPLNELKLPKELLDDLKRSEVRLPPYQAWKQRDRELLFLFSRAAGSSWFSQKTTVEQAIEELDKIHEAARRRVEKLDAVIAQEVERRHGFAQRAFGFKDLPPNLQQQQMQEIHRNSPIFQWMESDKPSESALTRARFEFDIKPTLQVSFQCGERQFVFSAHVEMEQGIDSLLWRLYTPWVAPK